MPRLPPELRGPIAVALARSEAEVPGASSLPGGAVHELKWDGYRVAVVRDEAGARLWSWQGKDLTDRFPDLAAAVVDQVQAALSSTVSSHLERQPARTLTSCNGA